LKSRKPQFDKGADLLGLPDDVRQMLRWPLREYPLPHSGEEWTTAPLALHRLPRAAQRCAPAIPNKGGIPLPPE